MPLPRRPIAYVIAASDHGSMIVNRNDYRMVVDMRFDLGRVCIRHVVTHRVYERLMKRGGL